MICGDLVNCGICTSDAHVHAFYMVLWAWNAHRHRFHADNNNPCDLSIFHLMPTTGNEI